MEEKLIIKDEQTKEITFDYTRVDEETAKIMKNAKETMFIAKQNTKYVFGQQLSEVQKKLRGKNQYDGFFEKWYESLNLKKDFVYDCINYYEVLVANSDNQMLKKLQFSKVCEIAKLKNDIELQKQVIDKAPLPEMKLKQVEELVKEVKVKKKLTNKLISEIMQKDDKLNSNLKNFIKVANAFIESLENQGQEMKQEEVENVLQLLEKLKELCPKVNENVKIEVEE